MGDVKMVGIDDDDDDDEKLLNMLLGSSRAL